MAIGTLRLVSRCTIATKQKKTGRVSRAPSPSNAYKSRGERRLFTDVGKSEHADGSTRCNPHRNTAVNLPMHQRQKKGSVELHRQRHQNGTIPDRRKRYIVL